MVLLNGVYVGQVRGTFVYDISPSLIIQKWQRDGTKGLQYISITTDFYEHECISIDT